MSDWHGHDGSKSWKDGGQVKKVMDLAGEALRTIVGNHVRDAVYQYANTAEYGLVVADKQLQLTVRYWNDEAEFTVLVPLRAVLHNAVKESYTRAADPRSMELLSALAALAKDLSVSVNRRGAK